MESSCTTSLKPRTLRATLVRGFSLVEMMVVLAIITIITTVTLLGHSNFDRSLLITDAAYSMALSVREMQTFGLSSRTYGGVQDAGYGLHVSAATPASYTLFADTNATGSGAYCPSGAAGTPEEKAGNCIYTAGSDGVVQSYTLTRGFRISNFCGKDTGGVRRCSNDGYLTSLSLVFRRPDTDSILNAQRSSPSGSWIRLTSAEVYLSTGDGASTRAICISSVGQISVSSSACP